jgi:hypothetical protein
MRLRQSSQRSSRAKPLQKVAGLNKIFNVTNPTAGGRLLGRGVGGFVAGLVSLILSLAISIVALALISLVYTQIETVAAEVTTLAVASLSLGTVALGLQVLGAAIPSAFDNNSAEYVGNYGMYISLITMIAYIVAGVLALLVATQVPAGSLQTYALIAGVFYIFIGGAYL